MATPLMCLWVVGGTVLEAWLLCFGGDARAPLVAAAAGVGAQAIGVTIGVFARRVPPSWIGHAILVGAVGAVSAAIWAVRPLDPHIGLVYLWSTPYAFILVRRRWAIFHVALTAAAWVATSELAGPPHGHAGAWLFELATLAAIGLVSGQLIVSLRGSHQLLQRAFEDAAAGLGVTDRDGRWLAANAALRELCGRGADELAGHPAAELLGDPAAPGARRLPRPDGREVWVEVNRSPVRDEVGGLACWSLQVRDVTAQRAAQDALRADAEQARWADEVMAALAEDRIVLHAQPLWRLADRACVGQEILVRLRLADGTVMAPGAFMPAVERFGLAPQLDAHIIARAVPHATAGRPLHVNLSAQSIGRPEPLRALAAALAEAGVDPGWITIEVTETALTDDHAACVAFGEAIAALGCRLALDDFGTGYGTLTYLNALPVDELKIDQHFVRALCTDAGSAEIVRAIVGLARSFGATTVGEGVEDEPTLAALRELGVDLAQGYLLGRPAPLAPAARSVAPPVRSAGLAGSPR
jgi:EAL domain-containing protein (putative c-di-GMP-specific phosphodiesterase class I)